MSRREQQHYADPMKVLENVYVTTRARRVHLDLPHSQVMVCVTCKLKENNRFIPELVKKVRSGVAREEEFHDTGGRMKSQNAIQCVWKGTLKRGTSSKMFCSRNVSGFEMVVKSRMSHKFRFRRHRLDRCVCSQQVSVCSETDSTDCFDKMCVV